MMICGHDHWCYYSLLKAEVISIFSTLHLIAYSVNATLHALRNNSWGMHYFQGCCTVLLSVLSFWFPHLGNFGHNIHIYDSLPNSVKTHSWKLLQNTEMHWERRVSYSLQSFWGKVCVLWSVFEIYKVNFRRGLLIKIFNWISKHEPFLNCIY